jgi:hypothetical protein
MRRLLLVSAVFGSACSDQTVGIHNTAPTVVITSHREGDLVLDGQATEFRAQAGDADGGSEDLNATWYVGGIEACPLSHPDENGLTSCSIVLTSEMSQPEVRVEVSDVQGDGAFDEVMVEVAPFEGPATEAPVVTWVAPEDGGTSPIGLVTFEATVTDSEDAPTDIALSFTSSIDGVFSTQGADSSGRATFASDALSEGDHVLTVRATDPAGLWTEDVLLFTIEPEVFVPNYDGLFTVDPAIHYDCQETFFNSTVVDFDIASFVFSIAGNALTVSGAPETMGQLPKPADENFSVEGEISGGCIETYILAGAFSDDDHWSGNFQVSFTGGQCGATNCTNQVWPVEGIRQ